MSLQKREWWRSHYVVRGFPMMIQRFPVDRGRMPMDAVPLRGRILWWLGVVRIHEDGDGWSGVFRWWHPITWCLFVAMIPVCAVVGEEIFRVVPMRVGRFFLENPERLIWWTPFSSRQGFLCSLPTKGG